MTDDSERQRPNLKYKLSKSDDALPGENEELHFYYNRERRLEKAPQSVKDLYKEHPKTRFSLFRPLVADKPRKILFFSIVVLCIMIWIISLLGYFDSSYSLEGNKIEISATVIEGITIVEIKKSHDALLRSYSGLVDIAVSIPLEEGNDEASLFFHRIFFSPETEEQFTFVVPFDNPLLLMVLQTENSSLRLTFNPDGSLEKVD